MSYHLFLTTEPGVDPPPDIDWPELLRLRRHSVDFEMCEITELSAESGEVEVWALQEGFEDGGWTTADFKTFYQAHGLSGETEEKKGRSLWPPSVQGTHKGCPYVTNRPICAGVTRH